MKEAAERIAKDLKIRASKKAYGVNGDQPPIAIAQTQDNMKDTSLEEVLSILNSSILIKFGLRRRWIARQMDPSDFSKELQESLKDHPELMKDIVFYPNRTTEEKLGGDK